MADAPHFFSPPQVAKQLGIDTGKVLAWIHTAELPAINIATRTGGRPRWRIAAEDYQAFLLRRRTQPQPPARRRRRQPAGVIEFY